MRFFSKQIVTILTAAVFMVGPSILVPLTTLAKDGSDDSGSSSSGSTDQTSSSSDTKTTTTSQDSHGGDKGSSKSDKKTAEKTTDFVKEAEAVQKTEKSETEVETELADNDKELQQVDVPKIESTKIQDVADADTTITGLEKASDTILTNLELENTTKPLLDTEKALLHTVINKHQSEGKLVQADLKDIKKQARELRDLLQASKGQKLTPEVRQALIADLQGLKDEIKAARDLARLHVQLVQAETK